jgi:CPA1 family monovalent cation:H+ antiporter
VPLTLKVSAFEQGNQIVFEDEDGDVLGVTDTREARAPRDSENDSDRPSPGTPGPILTPEAVEALNNKLSTSGQGSKWSMDQIKGKMNEMYRQKMEKRKQKSKEERRHEPARAFQFGNTVSLPFADGGSVSTNN